MEIECYGYQSLKAGTNNDLAAQKDAQSKDDSKKVVPSWVTNIGEHPRQMKIHKSKYANSNDIVVLGEQTLFIMSEIGGTLRF